MTFIEWSIDYLIIQTESFEKPNRKKTVYRKSRPYANEIHTCVKQGPTSSWMYCSRNGEARRLSTGMLKKPWISFWCKSIVMRWVRPAQSHSEQNQQTKQTSWRTRIGQCPYKPKMQGRLSLGWTHLPALHIIEASSLETMEPLFLILHCLL